MNSFVPNAEESEPIAVDTLDVEEIAIDALDIEEYDGGELEGFDSEEPVTVDDFSSPGLEGVYDNAEELDISELLQSKDDQDEFPSQACEACGKPVHPALLIEVDSRMFCAGCVPEYILLDEADGTSEDSFDLDLPPSAPDDKEGVGGPTTGQDTGTGTKTGLSNTMIILILVLLIVSIGAGAAFFLGII